MALVVDTAGEVTVPDLARLSHLCDVVLSAEGVSEAEVSLLLCDDATIAALNEQYLSHEGPTDVLSFPQFDRRPGEGGVPAGAPLGDVVISVDTAALQASDFAGWTAHDEVALLLVHGLLHLCGWNDLEPAERHAMRGRENHLLTAAGWPPAPWDGE